MNQHILEWAYHQYAATGFMEYLVIFLRTALEGEDK